MRSLESLSLGRTAVHRLHPLVKFLSAFVFIVMVASFGRHELLRLAPYAVYPVAMMALAGLPCRLLLSRLLMALPFCLFAGLSNVLIDKSLLSFWVILLKMSLCVMAALILVATTPFADLTGSLRRVHVPAVFVAVFETTYRYIGVLLEEASSMTTAYKLRSGGRKALDMSHMGAFVGQMLLRGFDRAERVHAAMECRGYSLTRIGGQNRRFLPKDALAAAALCLPPALLRFIHIW